MKNLKYLLIILLTGSILLTGCQSTTAGGATGSSRNQFLLISSEQINASAAKAYTRTLTRANAAHALNANSNDSARVKKIAGRLIAQVGIFRYDALQWNWEVNVINSKQVNAYCMPGGKIAVYSGLISSLKATDDELAAVIGHEISHALREHSREQISQQLATQQTISILSALAGVGQTGQAIADQASNLLITLPFSRTMETEADVMGLELMARAAYNPQAAVAVWEKMSRLGGSAPPEILSTHPSDKTRIANLKRRMVQVEPLYEYAKKSTPKSVPIKNSRLNVANTNNNAQPRNMRNNNNRYRYRYRYYR